MSTQLVREPMAPKRAKSTRRLTPRLRTSGRVPKCPRCEKREIIECHEWTGPRADDDHVVWFVCQSCQFFTTPKQASL